MAKPTNKSKSTKVTRIVAKDGVKQDSKPAAAKASASTNSSVSAVKSRLTSRLRRTQRVKSDPKPARGIWGYFKGSWDEIKQVRWPDRRSTWEMTAALIGFVVLFVIVVLLFDYGFQKLFNLITG